MGEKVVLVANESPTMRKIVELTLKHENIRVIGVADGLSAVTAAANNLPDLAVLDASLPGMDGYQVCQLIKSNAVSKHVPVVMLGDKDGLADKVKSRLAGSAEYVTKPFDPKTLIEMVTKYGRKKATA